jgi:hypothetical protein
MRTVTLFPPFRLDKLINIYKWSAQIEISWIIVKTFQC